MPILQAPRLSRTEDEQQTLRGDLGLPIPENRRAAGRGISQRAAE